MLSWAELEKSFITSRPGLEIGVCVCVGGGGGVKHYLQQLPVLVYTQEAVAPSHMTEKKLIGSIL